MEPGESNPIELKDHFRHDPFNEIFSKHALFQRP